MQNSSEIKVESNYILLIENPGPLNSQARQRRTDYEIRLKKETQVYFPEL